MAHKPLLANIDASVLEVHMHCRTEWPIGLIEAMTKAKQTTVRFMVERQRAIRSTTQYNP